MQFNSAIFIIFFSVCYTLYWSVPGRWKRIVLIASSLVFGAWNSIPLTVMFLILVAVNYAAGNSLVENRRKWVLVAGLAVNLSVLVFYKYFYLFAQTIGTLAGSDYVAHLRSNWIKDYDFSIAVPLGISFFTFQLIAYLVDCYRGTITERISVEKFYIFNIFFPKFATGPILRASDLIDQIDRPVLDRDKILNGTLLLLLGLFKKVLVADRIGALIGGILVNPSGYDAVYLILALPGYAAQVYCDFSGYTDIARGLAKLLGYEMPENFRGPLLASSMRELWQRWHITLSQWLRDYIYIPLGGSKRGEFRAYLNLMITMALGGFWHGATWTMLAWGTYMGLALCIERWMDRRSIKILPDAAWARPLRVVFTLSVFVLSAVFFAAPNIDVSFALIKGIATFQRGQPGISPEAVLGLFILAILFNVPQYYPALKEKLQQHPSVRYAAACVMTLFVGLLINIYGDISGSFIYFQF